MVVYYRSLTRESRLMQSQRGPASEGGANMDVVVAMWHFDRITDPNF